MVFSLWLDSAPLGLVKLVRARAHHLILRAMYFNMSNLCYSLRNNKLFVHRFFTCFTAHLC
jgi:hypothetical protein